MSEFWTKLVVALVLGAIVGLIRLFRERDAEEVSEEEYHRLLGDHKEDEESRKVDDE